MSNKMPTFPRFRYYNMLWLFLGCVGIIVWALHDYRQAVVRYETEPDTGRRLKHGIVRNYHASGKVKTAVRYHQGQKHGVSTLYYENGTPQLEMTFVEGKRHGVSVKYYKDGSKYAETPYENDLLTGIRKTYYESGELLAEMPYYRSLPGVGLKEYSKRGRELVTSHEFTFETSADRIYVRLSGYYCRSRQFFVGELLQGSFLDSNSNLVVPLKTGKKGSFIDRDLYENLRSDPRKVLICKCKTKYGNPRVLIYQP